MSSYSRSSFHFNSLDPFHIIFPEISYFKGLARDFEIMMIWERGDNF